MLSLYTKIRADLDYDEITGVVINQRTGRVAGNLRPDGYIRVCVDYRLYYLHRIIWLYMTGAFPEHFIDHIDGNRSNNAWSNLRAASRSQNMMNAAYSSNKSGYRGVYKDGNYWRARLSLDGKDINLGHFKDKADAASAYNSGALKYFGEFAKLNTTHQEESK